MQVESSTTPLLTIDEANEDTISAFEETDAAVDLRIKNSVCLVIDLEGFFVGKEFQVREVDYYSWNEHFGRHSFFQPAALKDLSHKDKKTVNFAKHNIHGLTYQRELMSKIKQILSYCDCTTNTRRRKELWWPSKEVMLKKTC